MLKERELQRIRKSAVEVAEEAGKVLMRFYRKRLDVKEKARSSLVTQADVKSEKLIQRALAKKFPSFQFLGEESGESNNSDPTAPMWHVDPLDGTTNFVHGFPMFCVSIGLAIGGDPIVGVIHIPTLGETFHGAEGCGAALNRKTIRTSKRKTISESLLTTGFAYLKEEEKLSPEIEKFERAHLEARAVRRPGAAAIDLAYVAAGVFDGFWERNLSSWDVCAGGLLVKEAGGLITDYSGGPFSIKGRELLATNGLIHKEMMGILR
jgi:myo-inositol-1(or 4)-monophosphatase